MSRFFAQMFVKATAVFGKAFVTAYNQAVKGGAPNKAAVGMKKKVMPTDEAFNVLNIDSKQLSRDIVEEQYKKYFASNDPGKGGSFYLQSKIFRAKESLDRELRRKAATTTTSTTKP